MKYNAEQWSNMRVKGASTGSTPGQDRVKDFFFKSSESHLVQTVQCLSHLHMLATHWRCAGDPVKAAARGSTPCRATVGPTPGQNRVKDPFLALRSHTLCRLFSACLTFMCSPHAMMEMHVKIPCSAFIMERPNGQ